MAYRAVKPMAVLVRFDDRGSDFRDSPDGIPLLRKCAEYDPGMFTLRRFQTSLTIAQAVGLPRRAFDDGAQSVLV